MKKGQISTEVIMIFVMLLIIFTILFTVFADVRNEMVAKESEFDAKSKSEIIGFTINNVFLGGNGTTATLFLEEDINNRYNYNLTISGRLVRIEWTDQLTTFPILTSNVSSHNFIPGDLTIINQEGGIHFEQ